MDGWVVPKVQGVQTLTQSVAQLTAADVAVFSAVLGPKVLKVFWATPAKVDHEEEENEEEYLYVSLQLDPKPAAKRRRVQKPLDPVRQVTTLVSTFATQLDVLMQGISDTTALISQLACEYLPPKPPSLPSNTSLSMGEMVADLQRQPFYRDQILSSTTEAASPAQYGSLSGTLVDARVWAGVRAARGISQLYSHQAQAISLILEGHDVVASTSTASGKSVIYQMPVLDLLVRDPQACVLIVCPTKALAQDQLAALRQLLSSIPDLRHLVASAFDGDTPAAERRDIYQHSSVILTNPDTLHLAMLPGTERWQRFWACLRIVVIDEMHVYQGTFGQHLSHILSRLVRISSNRVQFIACSATTSNPQDHMQMLVHRSGVQVVSSDGSPHGARHLVVWDVTAARPPTSFSDIAYVVGHLLQCGKRAIVFCRTRQACELALREIHDFLTPELRPLVMGYRGGYTASERRRIEACMFGGKAQVVVSTSALELGIDVGALDAVLMLGVPRSAASLWQQVGRAGRRSQAALAMVIATSNDRHLISDHVFDRQFEPVQIACCSQIAEAHLQCAAFERPIDALGEDREFVAEMPATHDTLHSALVWDKVTQRWACPLSCKPWPASKVSIRVSSNKKDEDWQVLLISAGRATRLLEEMDAARALYTLYEGGVFLHNGQTYSIDSVDTSTLTALVTYTDVSWYTEKRSHTHIIPGPTQMHAQPRAHIHFSYGDVTVEATGVGYRRIDARTKKAVETVDQKSPLMSSKSRGIWIEVPNTLLFVVLLAVK
ncbi:ATP-dependent 3'-5' DNA helicase [Coemansia sp. BCRC 34301]|nr:ATP-dependent 3'-5' DNA helicase [Coemansia sp. BCRC 34301]